MGAGQIRIRRLWEAVQRTSHELVMEVDGTGKLRFMSDAAQDLLGAAPAELVGRPALSLIHPEDSERASHIFSECVDRRVGWHDVRLRVLRADGGMPWVETSGIAHVGHGNRLLGFTATARRLDSDGARTLQLERIRRKIESVLEDRRLATVWQPVFSFSTGRIMGVEALSRFDDDGTDPPDQWFGEAFEVGLGVDLETLAIDRALAEAGTFPADVHVSVNASPATIAAGRLPAVIAAGPVPSERVVIELTEHLSVNDYSSVSAALCTLRDAGVRVAVDDAGAGFASFRHILRLNPDIIKLDQSITSGIKANPAQRALATAVVLFAIEVGSVTVIAEGVEDDDDLSTVSTLGIDAAQGFHIGRPVPASAIEWDYCIPYAWKD